MIGFSSFCSIRVGLILVWGISLSFCATQKMWREPRLFVGELGFNREGEFVLTASNFSAVTICFGGKCDTRRVWAVLTETVLSFKPMNENGEGNESETFRLILYDLMGNEGMVLEVNFVNRTYKLVRRSHE